MVLDEEKLIGLIVRVVMGLIRSGVLEFREPEKAPAPAAAHPGSPHRVVCLEDVRGKEPGEFRIGPGDVVTPLAREYMAGHGIRMRQEGPGAEGGGRP